MEESSTALSNLPSLGAVLPASPERILTTAEEDFAVYLSGGMKIDEAADTAGIDRKYAIELVTEPVFGARVKTLLAAYDRHIGITKATHAEKLAELREKAVLFAETNEKQQGALMNVALKAEQLRGELAGLYGVDTAGRVLGGTGGKGGVSFNISFVKPADQEPLTIEGQVV
jgi:hypothetical protein